MWRSKDPDTGQWGATLYRIFPDAWIDGLKNVPERFINVKLTNPYQDDPPLDYLGMDNPGMDNLGHKENQGERSTTGEEKGVDALTHVFQAAQQSGSGNWAVPADAGGADDWDAAVDAFARLPSVSMDPAVLPRTDRQEWSRVLRKIGDHWGVGPLDLAHVIEQVPKSKYEWKTWSTPHQAERDLGTLVGQHLSGGVVKGKNGGRGSTLDQLDELRRKLRQQPATVDAEYRVGEAI